MKQYELIHWAIKRLRKWANTNDIIAAIKKQHGVEVDYDAVARRVADINNYRYDDINDTIEKKRSESGAILYRIA